MRVLCLPVVLLFACTLIRAQSVSTAPKPTQDSQAVSVLTQALNSAGGSSAYRSISDYTATGNIAYHSGEQGTVTVRGFSGEDVRIDASLPAGTRSWAVYQGMVSTKAEDGAVSSMTAPTSAVSSSDAFPYQTPRFPGSLFFPFRQLGTVLGNPASFTISYKGVTQIDGHSVHDIQFQRGLPASTTFVSAHSRELFIDTSTLQIVMMRETLPKGVLHEVHYSDYQTTNGVLMPFVIAEDMGGQPTWSIELNQVSFNTGLQESSLAIQ